MCPDSGGSLGRVPFLTANMMGCGKMLQARGQHVQRLGGATQPEHLGNLGPLVSEKIKSPSSCASILRVMGATEDSEQRGNI